MENEQLVASTEDQQIAPSAMWRTALGRAIFGFNVEASRNQYFTNDQYLIALCNVENEAAKKYGRVLLYAFLFSVFAIASANNSLEGASFQGFAIATIPFLTEFCVVVLGVVVMMLVYLALDVFTMTRMRIELFATTGSEVPNMRMVHFKGNNAWLDAVVPKTVGYSSNILHRAIQIIAIIWSYSLPIATVGVVISAQLICIRSSWKGFSYDLTTGLVTFGFSISLFSILILVLVALLPLRFKYKGKLDSDSADEKNDLL